jgi:aspartyl-tRNA(Asn)/glutamyl-tRNA(Gln) amidotransferase subunit C
MLISYDTLLALASYTSQDGFSAPLPNFHILPAMSLNLDQVRRIADLARIELAPGEAERTRDQLNGIFGLIEAMQSANTVGVEPMAHAQDVSQRLRDDRATETDRHTAFQNIAPQVEAGLYLVPKVIE